MTHERTLFVIVRSDGKYYWRGEGSSNYEYKDGFENACLFKTHKGARMRLYTRGNYKAEVQPVKVLIEDDTRPTGFEKEAEEAVKNWLAYGGTFAELYIAGAMKQKEQMEKQADAALAKDGITLADLVAYDKGVAEGRRMEREEMMQKATEWLKANAEKYIVNCTESFPDAPFKAMIGGRCWEDLAKAMED